MATRMGNWLFHDRLTKTMRRIFFSWAWARKQCRNGMQRANRSDTRRVRFNRGMAFLRLDLYDRRADAVQGTFAVGGQVVAPRRVEIADVGGRVDEDHGS